ncbi:MAG: amidase [Pseudomonadota bacterium]
MTSAADNQISEDVAAALSACQDKGERLGAFVSLLPETAQATATYLDTLRGNGVSLGPLHGMPVGIKDIIDVAGMPTGAGSATRADAQPAKSDAFVVSKLRAAGAVMVGKTKTVEFAFGGWGTNAAIGTPWNPWDMQTHHTPGGSSSGTGAAVGGGLIPAGLGTDTGGSVRIPAAFCGCVGLKTSIGLVSRSGVVPLSTTFDTIGPLTETVAQAAAMLQAMQGEDATDPSTVGVARQDPMADLNRGVSGLRLARLSDADLPRLTPDVKSAFESAVEQLVAGGAQIGEMSLPMGFLDIQQQANIIIATEAYSFHGALADDPTAPLNAPTRARMLAAQKVSGSQRALAERGRQAAISEFAAAFDRFDALVLPAAPITAIPVADVDEAQMPMSLYTRLANYLDLAGLVVPIGLSSHGLPTSLQIVVRRLDDPLALRIGQAFEDVRGPFARPGI